MQIKEIMKLIKTDERFKNVFHFYSDSKSDFNDMLPTKELIKQFSFVNWIYMSELSHATLIGTLKNEEVFTMDDEGSTFILCKSFFEIPFRLIKTYLRGQNFKFKLHNEPEHTEYLNNLKFYAKWCEDNNIKIDPKYLEILKP